MHAVIKLNSLLFHLCLPVAVGTLSSYLAGNRAAAYASLRLPAIALPLAAIDIIWVFAYLCMGFSAYLIFTKRGISREERGACMGLYGLMLVADALWSFLFFRFRLFTFAAWWIVLLVAVSVLCGALFFRIRRLAGLFLVPCCLWLAYMGALSFGALLLN